MSVFVIIRDIPKGEGVNMFSNEYVDTRNNVGDHFSGDNFSAVISQIAKARGWEFDPSMTEYAPKTPGYPERVRRSEDCVMFHCALINDFLAAESTTAEWAWGDTYQEAFEELTFNDDERLG